MFPQVADVVIVPDRVRDLGPERRDGALHQRELQPERRREGLHDLGADPGRRADALSAGHPGAVHRPQERGDGRDGPDRGRADLRLHDGRHL